MALCTFAENYLMLGVTPVENLFIQEYLPRASGDYVRVYLYGLMQCYHPSEDMTLERTAHILDLPEETVRDAFQYWERQGLVRRVSDRPVTYQYLNLAATMANESPMDQAVYRHRDFNTRLQQLFGNRLLHPAEFMTACEWVEDLHLPEAVVLIMVENYIARHGSRFQFKSLNKMALRWAEEGVLTEAQAYEQTMAESDAWKLCEQVLKRFSLRRKPTADEYGMARKWLEEWKLTPKAVMAACTETVNARNPSFGYLDGILKRHVSILSGADVAGSIEEQKKLDDAVKAIHNELGMRGVAPMPEEIENYRKYIAAGFEPEAILRVARELSRTPAKANMQMLDKALTEFVERGQTSFREIETHLTRQRELREQAAKVLEAAGIENRGVTAADASQLEEWLGKSDLALILYAAECSRGKALPMAYAAKLLDTWHKTDITTVELARRSHEAGRPGVVQTAAKQTTTPNALNFQQRTYGEGELDYLFDRMNKYDSEEDEHDQK